MSLRLKNVQGRQRIRGVDVTSTLNLRVLPLMGAETEALFLSVDVVLVWRAVEAALLLALWFNAVISAQQVL